MRWAVLCMLLPVASCADPGPALRARDWTGALARAAALADPLAADLVRYQRLLTPGAADADEIERFLQTHPAWPGQGLLAQRYAQALAGSGDDGRVRALCARRLPDGAAGLIRCAEAGRSTGEGDTYARQAWLVGVQDAAGETAFLRRWNGAIDADVQWQRFERLAWSGSAAPDSPLARQAVRVSPAQRPLAEAHLVLRRGDAEAPALMAALDAQAASDPGLMLDHLRWLRRAERQAEAAQLWLERGGAAEAAAPEARQALFWTERNALIRDLLGTRSDELAYRLAQLDSPRPATRLESMFLAGWIALRRLGQPAAAEAHFAALAAASGSALTQSRAAYWRGRALAAAGQEGAANAELARAAAWPTTYYGQLAALALGEGPAGLRQRIAAAADPEWDEAKALDLVGSEFGRAATLLAAWGDKRLAKPFLQALAAQRSAPPDRAALARFALRLGLPEEAVAIARLSGRDGAGLPQSGWPAPADPPGAVERAIALGLMRQESSFDAEAVSPSGARGLMQLMPGTAGEVARRLGVSPTPLSDPALNMRLGATYLAGLLERFAAVPPALAGYNAGPRRAQQWLTSFGDPAAGAIDPVDWVELIPVDETRNYVQRVVENVVVYRARDGSDAPHPVLHWAPGGT